MGVRPTGEMGWGSPVGGLALGGHLATISMVRGEKECRGQQGFGWGRRRDSHLKASVFLMKVDMLIS